MSETYNLYNLEAPFKQFLLSGIAQSRTESDSTGSGTGTKKRITSVSIKNYLSDVRHFFGWLTSVILGSEATPESRSWTSQDDITQLITSEIVQKYKSYLESNKIPHKTINRRLSTIRKFCSFCISQGWMKENPAKKISNISNVGNDPRVVPVEALTSPKLDELSFPRRWESKLKSLFKNVFSRLDPRLHGDDRESGNDKERGDDKKQNNDDQSQPISTNFSNFGFQQYIAFLIVLIFVSVMGAGIYNQFFVKNQASLAYPTDLTKAGRILSFQGRLTDTLSNPITTATNVVFQLYSVSTGGTALYTTGTCSVTPDQDGIFSSLIGSDCGSEITASVFTENPNVYLGITVGGDAEMTPRQQIANVGYAINSETLQGLPPGTGTSVIPYINVDGNLLISASAPGIRSTSASTDFTLSSAKATVIQSAGTGDVILQATESGSLIFRTGGATGTNTRITVDNNGLVGIGDTTPLATLTVGDGDLFQVAGATGNVLTSGTMTAATNATINGIDISSGTVSDVVNLTINTGGDLTIGAIGLNDVGTTNITSGASLVGAFDEFDNSASTTVQDVLDDLDAAITTGGGSSMWSLASGVIYPTTVTNDLAIGGTTLAASMFGIDESAGNFYFGYDNSANPTLNFEATDADAGEFGFNTNDAFFFSNANVGIGNTAPSAKLDVTGNLNVTTYATVGASLAVGYNNAPAGPGNAIFSGNVGIGTTGPAATALLDLTSTTKGFLAPRMTTTERDDISTPATGLMIYNTTTNAYNVYNGTTWGAIGGGGGGDSLWTTGTGVIYPVNSTVDLLLGSTASSSAKFAFLNVNSGTPTASVSGSIANVATYLTGDGNLATTNMRTLTLGGSSTGAIQLSPKNTTGLYIDGTGQVGIGTITPSSKLEVNGDVELTNLFDNDASNFFDGGCSSSTSLTGIDSTGAITCTAITGVPASAVSFENITSGTNITAAMVVGAGGTLNYTSTGTINASSLIGGTWAIPGTIGSTTPNSGVFTTLFSTGTTTLGDAITDAVTVNAAAWTFANDTNFTLTGGVNGLSFDGTTFSVDATANRVGIGTAAPTDTLEVNGGILGSYFLDHSNTAYGIDPANTTAFGNDISMQISGGALMALDAGKVGIGVASPLEILDVGGNATVSGNLTFYGGARTIAGRAMNSLTIGDSQTGNLILNPGGNIGIGTTAPTTKLEVNGTITTQTGNFSSTVADSATATGFTLNTTNTLSTQGAKLLSIQNLGTEKMYLDKDGNLYVSGTLISGNGTSMLLTNKSGGVVANRSVVVLDSSNNSSFTTTTTPYSKAGFGVLVGVGLGVTNDANGDGICNADDICMIAYGGSVNVTVKNATTAVKGDYLFTSDTAGSAVASAKQYDGLIGIVNDTTNAASGYLKMIFKVQPQVTAAAAIDKGSKHNEYWLYADQYQAVGEGANTDTNLLTRGLAFDTFSDSTKTDSANTTVSFDTNTQKTGLIGGQTMSTATTDNDGQTYLGSNTVNDIHYYDRVKLDSAAQVQVELGIDPNWYNGVTLSVATTSAQFSQNSVITQKNPNLSTSYNGSLVKVTGTDATPRTIYITIKSPTTFDWTNYQGDAATGVTITPGTAQALGTTGVSATFTNARYNTGDVFKIASWFIEAESATRGTKQQFPERSILIAEYEKVDIIDADTQKLWMRFTDYSTVSNTSVTALNGIMYFGQVANGMRRVSFPSDSYNTYYTDGYKTAWPSIGQRNGTFAANMINSSILIVNATANDVSAAVIPNQPTQEVTVTGWGYIVGNGTGGISETVNLPYKFNNPPVITANEAGTGAANTAPTKLSDCGQSAGNNLASARSATTTSFSAALAGHSSYTFSSSYYYCYTWTATGQVSPRQFVAVATNAGVTTINETDQSAVNTNIATANPIGKISLTNNGSLYFNEGVTNGPLQVYYNVAGFTSSEGSAWANRGYYYSSASIPPIPATGNSINSIYVTPGTSTVDGKSNTIYLGSTAGTIVIQEKQSYANTGDGSDEANGSVKYYTKDYISEEMVGDIRGMWPLSANGALSLSDASVKADTLTNNGTATAVTGVRGAGVSLNGTTQYLSCTDAACGGTSKLDYPQSGGWSVGAWVNLTDTSNWNNNILYKIDGAIDNGYMIKATKDWDGGSSGNLKYTFGISKTTSSNGVWATANSIANPGKWEYVVATYDGTTMKIYVNGQFSNSATSSNNIGDSTGVFYIGNGFKGSIDEPFVTATALTAGQIKNMYQVGYRALQSHATTLGGGAADTNQQLGYISTGTNVIGDARPDWNNQFMYVGTNSTTLGAVSKIDLNSDTNIKTFTSSANTPTGGTLLIDEDTKSLAVGYNLEAVGSATTGVKTMGVDNNATATSGNFIGKTITTAESFTQAYLWAQYTLDASDASNTIQVWASNDGGSNYYQCNLTNTDSSRSPSEYEYFCQFNTAGSSLKTKFVMARGSTKTNTWVSKYGIAWIDSNAVAGSANGSGLFTNNNTSVADGGYLEVAHNQNSADILTNGWVSSESKWKELDGTYKPAIAWEGKDTEKGIYHNEVNLYKSSNETNIYTQNLIDSGLLFDTFEDGTKTDSTNTTASVGFQKGDDGSANPMTLQSRQQTGRTGLIGGQTLATSTTDNDGQTYLGSNTVNDTYYYDRAQRGQTPLSGVTGPGDSSPEVQVELGIDPNWYNGVTLSVATTSAQFSQNSTVPQKNPNLSTTYNGSLVKVTGTDSTPRTIYITIKSPTTFDWTNYQGDAATGVTITPGTAQTLGDTGVSATFTNARYNTGDVFKIASWFIEAESATRGAKQQFPERSNLVANGNGVVQNNFIDIIDADTQKLWMRFTESTSGAVGVENMKFRGTPSSVTMLNGNLYFGQTDAHSWFYEVGFNTDSGKRIQSAGYELYRGSISQRNAALGIASTVTGSTPSIVAGTVNDVSAAVIPNQPTQEVTVSGWGYMVGDGSTTQSSETVNLPYKFNGTPVIQTTFSGSVSTTAPSSLSSCGAVNTRQIVSSANTTSTSFGAITRDGDNAVIPSTTYICYTWTATGQVSPRQYVAVATGAGVSDAVVDGGISLINETDQSVVNYYFNAGWDTAKFVSLTSTGNLYGIHNLVSSDNWRLWGWTGVAGDTSNQAAGTIDKQYFGTATVATIGGDNADVTSLKVTEKTSTLDGKGDTIYLGNVAGLNVIQTTDKNGASDGDSVNEINGSVKYYTKDYISEEMVGDIRGMWPLSANGALSMSDASVKADTLTNNSSVTAVTGVRGAAASFSGSNYLSCTDAACGGTTKLDSGGTTWSIGAWFKTSTTGVTQTIISKFNGGVSGSYELYVSSANNLLAHVEISPYSATSNTTVTDGLWHFGAASFNGSTLSLYLDGRLEATRSISGSVPDSSANFAIGADYTSSSPSNYFTGSIDEPFVTATALTAGQIKNMYQVGYRALQSHATTLGGGAADTNQQLGYISTGTNVIGDARPDWNNQFMYVGTNSTTLGAVSKIDLNSDTNIKTYNSSANVPTGGALLIDEDTKSLAVGYNLEAVGSAASGVKTMGVDNNATATSGSFYSKTYTLPKAIASAVLWVSPILDSSDASNTLTIKASVDGGSSYATCTLVNTDTNPPTPEKEYACTFAASGTSLKVRFDLARGSTKTNTYLNQFGITWLGQTGFRIEQTDANTARLYNYTGEAQNLRLDVITGGLGRNAGTVSLAPAAADVDSAASTNSIWINKTGSLGNLLKLQTSGTDVLSLTGAGLMTLAGNFLPATDNTYDLGASSSARFRELYLGPASLHIQSKSTDAGSTYPALGLDYAVGINTAGSLVTSLNGASNALMTITQGGNVGIGTTAPGYKLDIAGAASDQLSLKDSNAYSNGVSRTIKQGFSILNPSSTYQEGASIQSVLTPYTGVTYPRGELAFHTRSATAGGSGNDVTAMYINGDGNVGIGTTGPGYKLHVTDDVAATDRLTLLHSTPYHGIKEGGAIQTMAATVGWSDGGGLQFMYLPGNNAGTGVLTTGMTLLENGNVGIGTTGPGYKLDVAGDLKTQFLAILSTAANSHQFEWYPNMIAAGGLGLYDRTGAHYVMNFSSAGYATFYQGHGDLAENYQVSGSVLRGSLISVDNTAANTVVASSQTKSSLLGVVSTKPGAVMDVDGGFQIGSETKSIYTDEKVPVALTGAAPVLITSQNGLLNIGDAIGISTIPGFGAKMITAGQIVGKALEKLDTTSCSAASSVDSIVWPEDDGKNTLKPCFRLPDGTYVGKIMVAVAPTWYDPDVYLTDIGDLEIKNVSQTPYVYDGNAIDPRSQILDSRYQVVDQTNQILTKIGAFSELVVGRIKSGFIETENMIVSNTLVAKNIIADNIQIAGKSLQQYIDDRIALVINSPIVETDKVVTNEIKPQNGDLTIDLSSPVIPAKAGIQDVLDPLFQGDDNGVEKGTLARLIIKGLEGKSAVVIDAAGNASFSGQIIADSLQINTDASVAGKLIAKEIHADNIDETLKQVQGDNSNLSSDINDIQKLLADIKNQPIPDANYYQNLDSSISYRQGNALSLQTESLIVTGQSNLYNVSVSNSLLVGTTIIDQNSIISLASELKLSALSTINLFDGAVIIAKDGKITTRGEIIAQGGIRTDEIKALTDDGQVSIKNLTINNLTIDKISTNSAIIAAADNFAQNGIFAPAIEAATASAGLGILPANQSEVIIYNDRVTDDSLVYLTPYRQGNALSLQQDLAVGQKENCPEIPNQVRNDTSVCKKYFKVVTNTPSISPSKFNWLIVN